MKKFFVKVLSLAIFVTSFDAQPLVALAAEPATDAYEAYLRLNDEHYNPENVKQRLDEALRDIQINATDTCVVDWIRNNYGDAAADDYAATVTDNVSLDAAIDMVTGDARTALVRLRDKLGIKFNDADIHQNAKPEYFAFVWGDVNEANALQNFRDGWVLPDSIKNSTAYTRGTSASTRSLGQSYSTGGITYEQENAYGTAEAKAGEWLNDTRYDATAGMPTTENLFIVVGGTQYIVDCTYEFITRPYTRRYHFDAQAANYRYHDRKEITDINAKRRELNFMWKDTTTTDVHYNLASPEHAAMIYKKGTETEDDDEDLTQYNAAWVNAALGLKINPEGDNSMTVEEMMQLIRNRGVDYSYTNTKNNWIKAPGLKDAPYKVTQFKVDNAQPYSVENWSVLYRSKGATERVLVTDDAGNSSYEDVDTTSTMSSATHSSGMLAAVTYKTQIYNLILELKEEFKTLDDNYRADETHYNETDDGIRDEAFDGTATDESGWMYTYYGHVNPNGSKNVWDPYIHSYLLDAKGGVAPGAASEFYTMTKVGANAKDVIAKAIQEYYTGVKVPGSLVHLDVKFDDASNGKVAAAEWNDTLHLHKTLYDNYLKYHLYTDEEAFASLKDNWLCYVNDPAKFNSTWSFTNTPYDSMGTYNQFVAMYHTAITDLFVSTSGLFYTDEIVELFGDPTDPETWFPGFNPTLLQGHEKEYNEKVSQNLHDVFGVTIPVGTWKWDVSADWSIPWACFPPGGDLDGAMEDDSSSATGVVTAEMVANNMADSPQYLDYTSFQVRCYLEAQTDAYRDQGAEYAVSWHNFCEDDTHLHRQGTITIDTLKGADGLEILNPDGTTIPVYIGDYICGEATGPHGCTTPTDGLDHGTIYSSCGFDNRGERCGNLDKSGYDCTSLPERPTGQAPAKGDGYSCEVTCKCDVSDGGSQCSGFQYYTACKGLTGVESCGNVPDDPNLAGVVGCYCNTSTAVMGGQNVTVCECIRRVTADKPLGPDEIIAKFPWIISCDADSCECVKHCDCNGGSVFEDVTEEIDWHSWCYQAASPADGLYDEYDYRDRSKGRVHGDRAYKEVIQLFSADIPKVIHNTGGLWDDTTKEMHYSETIAQLFDDIEYINVISYSMWKFDSSEVRGLASLVASYDGIVNYDPAKSDLSQDVLVSKVTAGSSYISYDADERKIHNDPGVTVHDSSRDYWNTLEMYGRIANSLRENSKGGVYGVAPQPVSWTPRSANKVLHPHSSFISDVPLLHYFQHDTTPIVFGGTVITSNYVNDDEHAFRLQNVSSNDSPKYKDEYDHPDGYDPIDNAHTDDLYFTYDPYVQGGRSHTTFGGFVMQAAARSLYRYGAENAPFTSLTLLTSEFPKTSFSNYIRIQGDYLAIRDIDYTLESTEAMDSHSFTLAGSMYDTWLEADTAPNRNRFSILNDFTGSNDNPTNVSYAILGRYLSEQPWIPGDMRYIQATDIYDHGNNCMFVHTQVRGINMEITTHWDETPININGTDCGTYEGNASLQGDINPKRAVSKKLGVVYSPDYKEGHPDWKTADGRPVSISDCRNTHSGKDNSNGAVLITQTNAIGEEAQYTGMIVSIKYDKNVTKGAATATGYTLDAVNDNLRLHAEDVAYAQNPAPLDNKNTCFVEAHTSSELPYIGYQSDGNGTDNIARNEGVWGASKDGTVYNGNYQRGYNMKLLASLFLANESMVSDSQAAVEDVQRSYDGGFAKFGIDLSKEPYKSNLVIANPPADVSGFYRDPYDSKDYPGGDEFSAYYPWLAGINLNRYLPNGRYYSCQVYNTYNTIVYKYDGQKDSDTTYNFNRIGENAIDQTLRVNARYKYTNDGTSYQGNYTSASDGNSNTELPNSIVIYNPVTTESAHLIKPDPNGYLPDAQNWGVDATGSPRYLAGFGALIRRDMRVGRHTEYGSQGSEDYNINGGVIASVPVIDPDSSHKEMKTGYDGNELYYWSDIPTRAYSMDKGYVVTNDGSEFVQDGGVAATYTSITRSGLYQFQTSLSGSTTDLRKFSVTLQPQDELSWAGGVLTLDRKIDDLSLTYQDLQLAYAAYMHITNDAAMAVTNTEIPCTPGMTITLGSAAGNPVHKGTTYRIEIPIVITDGSAIDASAVSISCAGAFNTKAEYTSSSIVYWMEATNDIDLTTVTIQFYKDLKIPRTSENILQKMNSIVMVSRSSWYSGNDASTIGYVVPGTAYSQANNVGFYNHYYISDEDATSFTLPEGAPQAGHIYSLDTSETTQLNYDMTDPHYVPNSNWRYYVLGWRLADGSVISSVDNPALAPGSSETLYPPIGYTGTPGETILTAALFDQWAGEGTLGVGRYSGKFYLFRLSSAESPCYTFPLTLDWYGITLYELDKISFGKNATSAPGDIVSYGMTTSTVNQVYNKVYNYAFKAGGAYTDINCLLHGGCAAHNYQCYAGNKDVRAFNVQYSANPDHKVAQDSALWDKDWVEVPDTKSESQIELFDHVATDFLSLDDEYTIYWDNFINIATDNPVNESINISSDFGRGWDSSQTDPTVDVNYTDRNSDDNRNVRGYDMSNVKLGSLKYRVADPTARANDGSMVFDWLTANPDFDPAQPDNYTDTTKWIRAKYVRFNVDMYGFTEGDSFTLTDDYDSTAAHLNGTEFDPTTPAVRTTTDADGNVTRTYNNIVYIPAGTKVPLGYLIAEADGKTDVASSNDGMFVDYGYNVYGKGEDDPTTKDPNKDNYVYHFWVPLHVGESDSQVLMETIVEAINNGDSVASAPSTRTDYAMVQSRIGDAFTREMSAPRLYAKQDVGADEWGNRAFYVNSATSLINNLKVFTSSTVTDGRLNIVTEDANFTRHTDAFALDTISVVGRIGTLTVVDTGDPRYQDTFKIPTDDGEAESDFIIPPIVHAVREYSNVRGAKGSQLWYMSDSMNVRGRLSTSASILGNTYSATQNFNQYGTQWYLDDSTTRATFPLSNNFNVHNVDNMPEQKLGYDTYLSVETIGNYYGSSNWRLDSGEEPANLNDDYGQTKVQIRPAYVYLEPQDDGTYVAKPVDVYFPYHGRYVPLNANSLFSGETEMNAYPEYGTDDGPYWLDVANASYYNIASNTNMDVIDTVGGMYQLDQRMMRANVSDRESAVTYSVVHGGHNRTVTSNNSTSLITTSILDPFELRTAVNEDNMDYMLDSRYYCGNTQIMFLRESNRTFIGGHNIDLNDTRENEWTLNRGQYAQKWYFTLGLPSTAVFVEHGESAVNDKTIINGKKGYILTLIAEMYAVGEKWVLTYSSDLSNTTIPLPDGTNLPPDIWKVYPDKYPNQIPISLYNTETMSDSDLDTRGTY